VTRYLIVISIGPVQEFIAAARRTADLYAGSQLLMEIVSAAAAEFSKDERIFPVNLKRGGANKILALVDASDADAAKNRADKAEAAAREALIRLWEDHYGQVSDLIESKRAKAQLDSLLEIYSAWTPVNGDYDSARQRVERLLSGRKALRDFTTPDQRDDGIPKSPLDPALATALALPEGSLTVPKEWQDKEPLRLKGTELLDAVSILKRLYGRKELRVLNTHTLAHHAKHPNAPNSDEDDFIPDYAYFAILIADGDSMGKLLSENKEDAQHKSFSEKLDAFAEEAKKIVEDCQGFPIYTGGDDVLALLPVTTALACGQKLAEAFEEHLKAFRAENVRPSLSAGIAIVHYREPLSISLNHARAAEKKAKAIDGKNAVCVALHTRGGAPLSVAQKWDEAKRIQEFQGTNLPRGLPHELRELAREWPEGFDAETLTAEAKRIARRKSDKDGNKLPNEMVNAWNFKSVNDLVTLSEQQILARFLSGKGEA
jgi:CRISPR-associated protein Cmr2